MGATKLCCGLGRSSKRWNRNGSRALDERFGDTSITGPTSGGWNQTRPDDHVHPPSSSNSSPTLGSSSCGDLEKSNSRKRWSNVFHSNRSTHSSQGSPQFTKDSDDTVPPGPSEKPSVVYKPASEDFLKSISEIRPRHTQPSELMHTTQQQQHQHTRPPSIYCHSTSQHSTPDAIPCHPSYQVGLRIPTPEARSSPSPRPPLPQVTTVLDRRADSRKSEWSPGGSSLASSVEYNSRFSPSGDNSDAIQLPCPLNTSQTTKPSRLKSLKKRNREPRKVTEELVPSTTEIFD